MQLSELLLPLRGTSLREGSRTADGCKAASSILHRGSKHRGPHSVTEPPHRGGCHEVTGGVRQDAAGHSTPQALRASSPSLRRCAPVLTPQSPTVTAPHPSVTSFVGDSSPRGGAKDQNKKLPAGSRNTKKPGGSERLQALIRQVTYFFGVIASYPRFLIFRTIPCMSLLGSPFAVERGCWI